MKEFIKFFWERNWIFVIIYAAFVYACVRHWHGAGNWILLVLSLIFWGNFVFHIFWYKQLKRDGDL